MKSSGNTFIRITPPREPRELGDAYTIASELLVESCSFCESLILLYFKGASCVRGVEMQIQSLKSAGIRCTKHWYICISLIHWPNIKLTPFSHCFFQGHPVTSSQKKFTTGLVKRVIVGPKTMTGIHHLPFLHSFRFPSLLANACADEHYQPCG